MQGIHVYIELDLICCGVGCITQRVNGSLHQLPQLQTTQTNSPFSLFSLCGKFGKLCRSGTAAVAATSTTKATASALALGDVRGYHEVVGDIICPSQVRGIDHIRDPRLNKVILSFNY